MGGFISAPTNLASPSAIGSTTPNTGRFTTLTLAPSANTTPFTASGYSLTGTNAQSLFDLSGTWNTSGTPTAFKLNVTDTASNASSLLMDLQTGGTSKFSVDKGGAIIVKASTGLTDRSISGLGTTSGFSIDSNNVYALIAGQYAVRFNRGGDNGVSIRSDSAFGITSGNADLTQDTILRRDAADTFAQRRSTNAQTFRIYRTFTDASNYERLSLISTRTTRFAIAAENAGTGAARSLEISFYTSASDPTSTDITSGCFSVWKNSGTGTIKLWANDGGTMKSVALA